MAPLLILGLLLQLGASTAFYETGSSVKVLSSAAELEQAAREGPVFVEFFAPW